MKGYIDDCVSKVRTATRFSRMRHPLYDSEVKAVLTFIHQGFNAVEADNLDTFTRTDLLTQDGNFALAKTLADYAHSHNLAFGQKNAAEYSKDAKAAVGFDVSC